MDSDFTRAVWIPAAQALITGLWAFVAGLSLCYLLALPWFYAGIISGLVSFGAWLYFWSWWSVLIRGDLMPRPPEMPQQEPLEPAEPQVVKVVITENQGRDTRMMDLPVRQDQLQALADGLSQGMPFNLGAWSGPQAPFTRGEFERLRAEMEKRRLIVLNSPHAPQRGYALTVAGQHLIKRLAKGEA